MRRVLCVWFPRLATQCVVRPERAGGRPLVTAVHGGTVVAAVSKAAEAAGVRPGMKWGDAQARCRSLVAVPPDPEREARSLRAAARMAERYGPWVVEGEDGFLADVTGTAHLFGGEPAMLEDCRRVFGERGWSVRAAVAEGPGAAWGLARFAARELVIGSPEALRRLPVEALRVDAGTAARLRRIGLRCVGDLADRPRTALAERFGERLVRRLARMLGERAGGSEPLGVCPPRPALRVRWEGMESLLVPEAVETVCAGLLETLCARLRRGDLGARKIVLALRFDPPEAARRRLEVRAGRGLRDAGRWLALFRERRGAFDPGGGVVRLDLAAAAVEPFDPAAGHDREALWERLSARLGPRNVVRFRSIGRHRPEAAFAASPVVGGAGRPLPFPTGGEGNPRPLRLLVPPEPIGVERTGDDPLDPPAALRRRGRVVRLRWAEGPERIASEWWCDLRRPEPAEAGRVRNAPHRAALEEAAPGRDYWRVETEAGARLWVYREICSAPRWFLHGTFP